jgi:hypothetical protein
LFFPNASGSRGGLRHVFGAKEVPKTRLVRKKSGFLHFAGKFVLFFQKFCVILLIVNPIRVKTESESREFSYQSQAIDELWHQDTLQCFMA